MSRSLRIQFPGAVYHVTSRGDRRESIFADELDRVTLLAVVEQGLQRFDAQMLAFCLMGNHYHFVVHTRSASLSLLMRHINGVYSQRFNRRHGVVGHVLQGRFKAILVDRDAYLLALCRQCFVACPGRASSDQAVPMICKAGETPTMRTPWYSATDNSGLSPVTIKSALAASAVPMTTSSSGSGAMRGVGVGRTSAAKAA